MEKFQIIEVPNSDGITPTKFEAWGYDSFASQDEAHRWCFWVANNYLGALRRTLARDFPGVPIEVVR